MADAGPQGPGQGGAVTDLVTVLQQIAQNGGRVLQTLQGIEDKFPDWVDVPATASSTGTAGQVAYSPTFLYVCVGPSTWKRTALSTF